MLERVSAGRPFASIQIKLNKRKHWTNNCSQKFQCVFSPFLFHLLSFFFLFALQIWVCLPNVRYKKNGRFVCTRAPKVEAIWTKFVYNSESAVRAHSFDSLNAAGIFVFDFDTKQNFFKQITMLTVPLFEWIKVGSRKTRRKSNMINI